MSHKILLGAHVSIAHGLHHAFERAVSIGCTVCQIFVKSSRSWFEKKLTDQEINLSKQAQKQSGVQTVIAHAGYLINIGSTKQETEKKSCDSLLHELTRCEALEIPYLVLHPGAHLGAGPDVCIKQIAKNLDTILNQTTGVTKILLETTAGQGTNVGYTFEQLALIRSLCDHKKNIEICLDTCHVFAAGYDITSTQEFNKTIKLFDDIIGLTHLKAIHLNDSKGACGSRLDRHEPLGKGHIPLQTFKLIMNHDYLSNIPKILETPADVTMSLWVEEIKLLKNMVEI
jgi:deoxyribonuclease-4